MAMEPKPDQPLADQPIVVNDEGTVLSTSDGGAEDGGTSPSRRRRSSMFGLKSASSFGDVALEMSMAELARMLGASTVLVFLITFIAAVILSA